MVKLALLYDIARWEEKSIVEAAKRSSVELELVHVPSVSVELTAQSLDFALALQRCASHARALASTIAFEAADCTVVNDSQSLAIARNKLWTTAKLIASGVPVPKTSIAFSEAAALKAAEAMGYPVVVKPIDGSWGRLVSLADDEEDIRAILEHREQMANPSFKVHYIQEFVRKPGRDIRVCVIGDEVPAAIYRVSSHWITNTARGGRAEPVELDGELEDISIKAARAVGAAFAGVDVFEDPARGYLVCEVNAVPEFKNTVKATGVDIPGKLIDYLAREVRR